MRRSRIVESQRKTCIAKHSGKCHLKLFLPALPPRSCSYSWLLTPEGFLIIPFNLVLSSLFIHIYASSVLLLLDTTFLPHITSFLSPFIKQELPLLQLNLRFVFPFAFPLVSLHWQIEVSLNAGGILISLTPSRGAKAANSLRMWLELCHNTVLEWDLNRNNRQHLGGNERICCHARRLTAENSESKLRLELHLQKQIAMLILHANSSYFRSEFKCLFRCPTITNIKVLRVEVNPFNKFKN